MLFTYHDFQMKVLRDFIKKRRKERIYRTWNIKKSLDIIRKYARTHL